MHDDATEYLPYFEFHRDGETEFHRCTIQQARRLAMEPQVVFAAILGDNDGCPGVVKIITGQGWPTAERGSLLYRAYEAACSFAQDELSEQE